MRLFSHLCLVFSGFITSLGQLHLFENDECVHINEPGICRKLSHCKPAYDDVKNYKMHNYTRCGFNVKIELVCCPASLDLRLRQAETNTTRIKEACKKYTEPFSNILVPQIFGGKDAEEGQFPFMAALGLYNRINITYTFLCGGTLISERHILTAAHCLSYRDLEVKIVRLGVIDVPYSVNIDAIDPVNDFKVKNYTVHPNYVRKYNYHDIAIIELKRIVEFSNRLRPACLFNEDDIDTEEFIIAGWGLTTESDSSRKDKLQMASVTFLPHESCARSYAVHNRSIRDTELCAIHDKSDACSGDSGGPLILTKTKLPVVVGVTSYGFKVCGRNQPTIYMRVSKYIDWIQNIVWPHLPEL